jgi:hypothetical protein
MSLVNNETSVECLQLSSDAVDAGHYDALTAIYGRSEFGDRKPLIGGGGCGVGKMRAQYNCAYILKVKSIFWLVG